MKLHSIKTKAKHAFTLIEIVVTVAILGIIIFIAVPALSSSRQESLEANANGSAKTLNDALTRARIKGDTNPVLDGNDAVATTNYLIAQGYVQPK